VRLPEGRFVVTIESESRHDAPLRGEPFVDRRQQIA
jgi:hypothetical protein